MSFPNNRNTIVSGRTAGSKYVVIVHIQKMSCLAKASNCARFAIYPQLIIWSERVANWTMTTFASTHPRKNTPMCATVPFSAQLWSVIPRRARYKAGKNFTSWSAWTTHHFKRTERLTWLNSRELSNAIRKGWETTTSCWSKITLALKQLLSLKNSPKWISSPILEIIRKLFQSRTSTLRMSFWLRQVEISRVGSSTKTYQKKLEWIYITIHMKRDGIISSR